MYSPDVLDQSTLSRLPQPVGQTAAARGAEAATATLGTATAPSVAVTRTAVAHTLLLVILFPQVHECPASRKTAEPARRLHTSIAARWVQICGMVLVRGA